MIDASLRSSFELGECVETEANESVTQPGVRLGEQISEERGEVSWVDGVSPGWRGRRRHVPSRLVKV